jgi:hypothetical protein
MQRYAWLRKKTDCGNCGEPFQRHEMRYDEANPCSDGSSLTCRICWDSLNEGTMGDPDYRPPLWPAMIQDEAEVSVAFNGMLRDSKTKNVVGRVQGFNPKTRFAQRVTLFAFPDEGEHGTIDPADEVVIDHENPYIIKPAEPSPLSKLDLMQLFGMSLPVTGEKAVVVEQKFNSF